MYVNTFPAIDLAATGANIKRIRLQRSLTVRDVQEYFGFEEPQAIYKWQSGKSLPTVDNLYALSRLFQVSMDEILVPANKIVHLNAEQHVEPCCSCHFLTGYSGYGKRQFQFRPFFSYAGSAACQIRLWAQDMSSQIKLAFAVQ
jgi:transcriptional regulator with XRE-family HTH domain